MFGEYCSLKRVNERHQDTIRDCSCVLSSQQAAATIYSGKFMGVMEGEKKKEQSELLVPELLCLHIGSRTFLDATCKIIWIFHDVPFPLAQHNVSCTHPFYHALLLPYLHTVSLLTSIHVSDRPGLLKQWLCILFFWLMPIPVILLVQVSSGVTSFWLPGDISSPRGKMLHENRFSVPWFRHLPGKTELLNQACGLSRGPYTAPERYLILQGIVPHLHLPVHFWPYITSASIWQISHMFHEKSLIARSELRSRYWLILQQCCRMLFSSSATALPSHGHCRACSHPYGPAQWSQSCHRITES